MAKRAGLCYYKILQRFIRDSNDGRFQPVFTHIIKKYGLAIPTLSKMLVHYLCKENNADSALGLITELNQNNLKVNFPCDLIQMLTEQGRPMDAYKLVIGAKNDLPTMDVVDYSIIIDGLCKGGWTDKALEICNFARRRGVVLNVVTYNSLFNGLCRQGCLVEAFRLFDSLERHKIVPSDMTYGTLIDSLVREGFLLDARQLFERMMVEGVKPNTHIYNSLINGYCKIGNVEEALKLVCDLENISLKPDKFTVSAVIYGFSLEGDMEGALHFFIDKKRNGFSPDFLGFLYLVRGLCAKGRMEEARNIMREMLQDESVAELINRVDVEIEDESIASVLVDLCEQGSIQGALVILNEIGAMFFPYKRSTASGGQESTASCEEDSRAISLDTLRLMDEMDFNVLYSQVAFLCKQGDLSGANALAKSMMTSLVKNS